MFSLSKPDRSEIDDFVASLATSDVTYAEVGLTLEARGPEGFAVDHNQILLGTGEEVWRKAKEAVSQWKMFDLGWVELCWPWTPIEIGQNVAILIRHYGSWSLNGARIVYTIDEPDRFGFAYGTLADHGERGEERFSVIRDANTDEVVFDIFAFSKPAHLLARIGYPLTRHLQRRFALDSRSAIKRAILPVREYDLPSDSGK